MDGVILVTMVATLCCFVAGMLAYHWWLRHRPAQERRDGVRRCEICDRELSRHIRRQYDGIWRCKSCQEQHAG